MIKRGRTYQGSDRWCLEHSEDLVERRLRLDPPVGRLGRGGAGDEDAEDERDQKRAAHGGAG